MATLQIRIDPKLKKEAQKVAKQLGMDLSTAVKIFLVQMIIQRRIPFEIRTVNGLTLTQEWDILRDLEDVKKSKKSYAATNGMMKDILSNNRQNRVKSKTKK